MQSKHLEDKTSFDPCFLQSLVVRGFPLVFYPFQSNLLYKLYLLHIYDE